MPFDRELDSSFPCVYDTWKAGDSTFVIQDLPPEDEEEALRVMVDALIVDETLCSALNLIDDPLSVQETCDFWRQCFAQRMSLACYEEKDGVRKIVGANVCFVKCKGEEKQYKFKGKWQDVYDGVKFAEKRCGFEYLGTDKVLFAVGLAVRREYRGAKLGQKILNAREPLALAQGVKGTATTFTSIGGQKTAERSGFVTIAEATLKELAEAGMPFPADDRSIKFMVKKFKK